MKMIFLTSASTSGHQTMVSHHVSQAVVISILLSITVLAGARIIPAGHGGEKAAVVSPQDSASVTCTAFAIPQGYDCKDFEVQTKDGYILSLQRIPNGRNASGGGAPRTPVLLQHGVCQDGITWMLNSPQQSLAYILADSGYDVWIANARGTSLSSRHVSLNRSDPAYWDWSWDEMAAYDLPAMADFVYQQTGQKLDYVGHSLGTLTALASLSQGGLVDKLRSAALLSPVAYLSHLTTALVNQAAKSFLGDIIGLLGVAEFLPLSPRVDKFVRAFCNYPGVNCLDILSSITGPNCCINSSTMKLYLRYEPQLTATRNMVHLSQTLRDGVILKYNYGNSRENIKKYGQLVPPAYNLQSIPKDFPLFLSYGGLDALSDVVDVQKLLNDLRQHNPDKLTVQFVKNYAHADFVMATNAKQNVYDAMLAFFSKQ